MFLKIIKLSSVALFLVAFSAQAARVVQSKNGKVLIDLDGAEVAVDQDLFLLNTQNKKVALVKILQVKNGKAIAAVTKGKADGTETLQLPLTTTKSSAVTEEASTPTARADKNDKKVFYRSESKKASVVLSLMSNSMTTKQADGTLPSPNVEDVGMKGSTFGITGVLDWPVGRQVSLRGTAGYEPFKAAGTATYRSCDSLNSFECTANINYLSGGGYLRYDFMKAQVLFWVAAGGTIKFPMSKTTTALKQDDIKMTMTYGASAGLDYFINPKYFVPVSLEQQYFLKSDTVDANIMMLRAGFGMAL